MQPVLVLGIGNILLRDEGIGVRVIEAIQQRGPIDGVDVMDGGAGGVGLIDAIADRRKVIVVDAVDGDLPPGAIVRMGIDDLASRAGPALSLHEMGLLETFAMARRLDCAPAEIVILGVQPADISTSLELSPELARRIPEIVDRVCYESKKR